MKKLCSMILTLVTVLALFVPAPGSAAGSKEAVCPACRGTGTGDGFHEEKCTVCSGKGQVDCKECDQNGKKRCPSCKGNPVCQFCEGKDPACEKCHGKGIYCDECEGAGKVTCHICGGTHLVKCTKCDGGTVLVKDPCPTCGGTGKIKRKTAAPVQPFVLAESDLPEACAFTLRHGIWLNITDDALARTQVYMGSRFLAAEDFSVSHDPETGTVTVVLSDAFLETLAPGKHDVRVFLMGYIQNTSVTVASPQ